MDISPITVLKSNELDELELCDSETVALELLLTDCTYNTINLSIPLLYVPKLSFDYKWEKFTYYGKKCSYY